MMRLWIFLAALAVSAPASADNILMKNKGLGAAVLGGQPDLAVTLFPVRAASAMTVTAHGASASAASA